MNNETTINGRIVEISYPETQLTIPRMRGILSKISRHLYENGEISCSFKSLKKAEWVSSKTGRYAAVILYFKGKDDLNETPITFVLTFKTR